MSKKQDKVNLLTVLYSGLRHRWLAYFCPRYTIDSLMKRKGSCQSCGLCCLLNKPRCAYLKDGKCEVYYRQPFFCRIFPIDEKDKKMSCVEKECGYFWKE